MDNVSIERLWRSLKYEEVYLKDYADRRQAPAEIGRVRTRRWAIVRRWRSGGKA